MKGLIRYIGMGLLLIAMMSMTGCTDTTTTPSSQSYATITDDLGRTVTLTEKPKRIIVLSSSLLTIVDGVDGDIVGRSTATAQDNVLPERYKEVADVGPVYGINMEKVLALQPDLIFINKNQHEKWLPLFEENHIPAIAISTKSYDDVKKALRIVGKVYHKDDVAEKKIAQMDEKIATLTKQVPKEPIRIAIIHATPSQVTLELPSSIAGSMATQLGFQNIAAEKMNSSTLSGERIPYSMEVLVQQNPDIIYITSMGAKEKIDNSLRKHVENDPAWSMLKAVKEKRVYVLPQYGYLISPGISYPDYIAHMARLAFPEANL